MPSVIGISAAIILARGLQRLLPFTYRPLQDPTLGFAVPAGVKPDILADSSAFPSDHAVLYFAVATAIFLANRQAGILAYIWTVVFTCLTRVYVGFHFPSDVLGGAALGALVMWLAFKAPLPVFIFRALGTWEERHAPSLWVLVYLFAFSVATVFEDPRALAKLAIKVSTGVEL